MIFRAEVVNHETGQCPIYYEGHLEDVLEWVKKTFRLNWDKYGITIQPWKDE